MPEDNRNAESHPNPKDGEETKKMPHIPQKVNQRTKKMGKIHENDLFKFIDTHATPAYEEEKNQKKIFLSDLFKN